MKASRLFRKIDDAIPPGLAVEGDRVGFVGPGDPDELDVERVLVLMDWPLPSEQTRPGGYDLLVLHHPPPEEPEIPAYVIHSNWDLLDGGACDALAECLGIETDGVLDERTGLGRIGRIRGGPVPLARFSRTVAETLGVNGLKIVNYREERPIERVGVVSGFGLRPDLVDLAIRSGVDLYLSGDLTHAGAMRARNTETVVVDATHHATELPGLYRLGACIAGMGVQADVMDTGVPWRDLVF